MKKKIQFGTRFDPNFPPSPEYWDDGDDWDDDDEEWDDEEEDYDDDEDY